MKKHYKTNPKTQCNELLTFVSLTLAIGFTVYKFMKFKKDD